MFSLDHLRAPLSDGIATVLGDAQNQDRLIDLIPAWISYLGPDRRYRFANKQYRDRFALSEKDIVGMHVRDILGAEAYATAKPQLDEAYRGRRRSFENRIRSALGEERVIRVELIPDFRDGRVNGVVSLVTDITEQKRAEDALKKERDEWERRFEEQTAELRESEQRFRRIFEDGHFGMALAGPDGRFTSVNEAYCRMLGYTEAELTQRGVADITHPDDVAQSLEGVGKILQGEAEYLETEKRYIHKSGEIVWVRLTLTPVRSEGGTPRYTIGITEDITERRNAEQAVRDSEQRFREIFENSPLGMVISQKGQPLARVNAAMCRLFGYSADEFKALTMRDLTHPDDLDRSLESVERAYNGEIDAAHMDKRYINKSGDVIWARTIYRPVRDKDGTVLYGVTIVEDITEAKRTTEALHVANERMRAFLENTPDGILMKDVDGRIVIINPTHERWHGESNGNLIGKTAHDLYPPEIANRISAEDRQILANNNALSSESELTFRSGVKKVVEQRKFPIRDRDDRIMAIGSINRDVTEQRQAEAQLRSAQRMEAVGQLTGGVAHDFNNLLAVIIGSLELARDQKDASTDPWRLVDRALSAADKGATLVERLLAFSRAQKLKPQVVKLDTVIENIKEMLRHSLSEAVNIEFVSTSDLWQCEVDPNQLENAILNLATNAADAIFGSGTFRIETSNVVVDEQYSAEHNIDPGEYVCLRVSDTGKGISPDIISRVAEPFFTTKEVGEGTGLGLSMVHGFVNQSGGHLDIQSEPGEGTCVSIYLPRTRRADDAATVAHAEAAAPDGRGQTVLVVEDDPMVRELVVSQIEALGYNTVEAEDGPQAMTIADRHRAIDLLLTDIILPNGMNGCQVAEALCARSPGLKVLYMSGYSDNILADEDQPGLAADILQKPFRKPEMARALAAALA